MLNIVLFGPPGAGKGTQSQKLIDKYGLVHLSTGDLLRSEIANGTALGMEAKAIMDRGDLVNDEIVIGMIESKLDANPNAKGFIFDGFPRTQAQAVALDDLLQKKGTAISGMLALEVDNDELVKRLLLRGKETGRPDDQDETIITNRVKNYNNETLPLKKYYSEQSKFHSINGIGTIDSIFNDLVERITFVNAEIELTMLENDIEHLDLTVNDFEEATEISPELQKDMDEVRKEDGKEDEEKEEEQDEKKGILATIKEKVAHFFSSDKKEDEFATEKVKVPAKKAAAKKPAPKAPAKKAAAPARKATPKASPKKAVKKEAPKKAAPKKATAKKAVKKSAPKKAATKAPAKKAIKKAVKKVAAKAPVKKVVKKIAAKKTVVKKAIKKAAPKKAVKKVIKKAAAKAPVKKAMKAVKKVVKKTAPAKTALKKVVKKAAAKPVIKKAVKAVKKAVKKVAPKKAAKKKK